MIRTLYLMDKGCTRRACTSSTSEACTGLKTDSYVRSVTYSHKDEYRPDLYFTYARYWLNHSPLHSVIFVYKDGHSERVEMLEQLVFMEAFAKEQQYG